MVVTFYKTKLNKQNRCYGSEQYDSYLNTCEKKTFTLSHDVIPNQTFNIDTEDGMWGYNYITFTYRNYLFGSFIDSINIQAISNTTVIYHSTDNWYFALKNIGIGNIDFHGRVMRGHVKDTDEQHKPILDNTTLTAEEVFNNSNLKFYDFTNCTGSLVTENTFNKTWYLYLYFANPSKVVDSSISDVGQTQYINGVKYLSNNGITACYPVVLFDDGFYICKVNQQTGEVEKDIKISDLTSSNITSITLSKVSPDNGVYFKDYSETEVRFYDSGVIYHGEWIETAKDGLPSYASIPRYFSDVEVQNYRFFQSGQEYDFSWLMGNPLVQTDDYDKYLKQIPKFTSLVYNPYYFGGSIVDMYKQDKPPQRSTLSVAISMDLTSYVLVKNMKNLKGNRNISTIQNTLIFAPDTVLDYWSRLNALQTANAGRIQENSGINQGVNNIGSTVKKGASVISSIGNVVGSIFKGDIGGIIGGVSGAISSGTDTVTNAMNLERNQENANLTAENGRMIQETANFQYNTGETRSEAGAGYYNSYKAPAFISIVDNEDNYKQICTNLHRFGYNTFLQVDDVYFNHVREHFNYIQCSEIEVTGVPADIADDIANMFLKGVHLWQDDVENFERTNYSKGEWNV